MGLPQHRVPPSELRRRLAIECGELLAEMHETWLRAVVVRHLAELELGSLYDLRNRLAGVPPVDPDRVPA